MPIKVTINHQEIKNPVARFLVTLVGLAIFLLFFILIFFLLLPLVWFMALSVALVVLALIAFAPKVVYRYRIVRMKGITDSQRQIEPADKDAHR